MSELIYYIRDKKNRPTVTVCLIDSEGRTYRGIAVCGTKDQPTKRVGRRIAIARALLATKGHYSYVRAGIQSWVSAQKEGDLLAELLVLQDLGVLGSANPGVLSLGSPCRGLTRFETNLIKDTQKRTQDKLVTSITAATK